MVINVTSKTDENLCLKVMYISRFMPMRDHRGSNKITVTKDRPVAPAKTNSILR